MLKKGFGLIEVVVLGFVVVMVATIAYVFLTQESPDTQNNPTVTPTVVVATPTVVTASPTASPTADWETYDADPQEYTVQYPTEWVVYEVSKTSTNAQVAFGPAGMATGTELTAFPVVITVITPVPDPLIEKTLYGVAVDDPTETELVVDGVTGVQAELSNSYDWLIQTAFVVGDKVVYVNLYDENERDNYDLLVNSLMFN